VRDFHGARFSRCAIFTVRDFHGARFSRCAIFTVIDKACFLDRDIGKIRDVRPIHASGPLPPHRKRAFQAK
jgi:hypothetical protein